MLSQEATDLNRELGSTKSVRAAVTTFATSVHQRMRIALDADNGRGDLAALRTLCDDLGREHLESIVAAISSGTVAEHDDQDPDAPAPASNPGSTGTNVFGSKGPEDTDTNRNSSLGYAGRDVLKPGAQPDGGVHQNGELRDTSDAAPTSSAQADSLDEKPHAQSGQAPTAAADQRGVAFPASGETVEAGNSGLEAQSATAVGAGAVQQDQPAGESAAAQQDAAKHGA